MMSKTVLCKLCVVLLAIALMVAGAGAVSADGTEILGPPSIEIAEGSGIAVGGFGLFGAPGGGAGQIDIEIPAGTVVKQVLLYWAGEWTPADDGFSDNEIWIDGNFVTGTLIGGPTLFYEFRGDVYADAYRADVTDLNLVSAGLNSVPVADLGYNRAAYGAGLLVIYQEALKGADIQIVDGSDLAFYAFAPPLKKTVEQVFTFEADNLMARTGSLSLFVGSVTDYEPRPNQIVVTVGDQTPVIYQDLLMGNDGPLWDSIQLAVEIPAGVTTVKVQVLSKAPPGGGDYECDEPDPVSTEPDYCGTPASLNWIAAGLSVPTKPTAVNLTGFAGQDATPGFFAYYGGLFADFIDYWLGLS